MRVGLAKLDSRDGRESEVFEVEDDPIPACLAECFPNPKCSQPKRPPAWLSLVCVLEECPPPEWPPPPPCCASARLRKQTKDSKIERMRSDRTRKVAVAMAPHPNDVITFYSYVRVIYRFRFIVFIRLVIMV